MKNIITAVICLLLSYIVYGQQKKHFVSGKVYDHESNQPLVGASVSVLGTSSGTTTDTNGYFSIVTPDSADSLEVSFIGYKKLRIKIDSNNALSIGLISHESPLNEIVVVADRLRPFNNTTTSVGTRIDTRQIELPQSVQTIPYEVIRVQQASTINELTKNMVGVTTPTNLSIYTMRGFPTYEDGIVYNGFRGNPFLYHQNAPLWNVENVEVVRGPASALFSVGAPGGVISINTKKPLFEAQQTFIFNYGSWDRYDLSSDLTGPLTKDKRLLYRLNIGYLNRKSFRDFQHLQTLLVAPSLSYNFSAKTEITVEYMYNWSKQVLAYDRGTVVIQQSDSTFNWDNLDISFNHGSPVDNGRDLHHHLSVTVNHEFGKNLRATLLSRAIRQNFEMAEHWGGYGTDPMKVMDTLPRYWDTWYYKPYNFQNSLFALYKTGKGLVKQTILGGIDLNYYGNTKNNYIEGTANPFIGLRADYSKDAFPKPDSVVEFIENDKQSYRLIGGYIQDQINIGEKVKLLIALRYDDYFSTNVPLDETNYTQVPDSSEATAFLPRAGVVFNPKKNMALYASYTESFLPQYSNNASAGGPFPPQKGLQYEAGFKGDFLKDNLSMMVAAYTIDYINVLAVDPNDPTGLRQIPVSGVNSKGVEFTLQSSSRNINVIAGYAYNNTKLIDDSEFGNKGDQYANAPHHTANLFVNYKLTGRILEGFSLGFNSRFVSERLGVISDQKWFVLPSYLLFDATLMYHRGNFTITGNLYNVLDERYIYGGYYSRTLVLPGDPRNFRMGVSYSF